MVSERCGADISTDGTAGFVTAQLQRANITREITAGRDGVPCGGRGLQADVACSEVTGATWTPPATPPVCPLPGRCQQGARCWNVRRVLVLPRGDAQPCHCASEKTDANRNGRENSLLGLESQFCWTAPRGTLAELSHSPKNGWEEPLCPRCSRAADSTNSAFQTKKGRILSRDWPALPESGGLSMEAEQKPQEQRAGTVP